jgi:hypothetical protein
MDGLIDSKNMQGLVTKTMNRKFRNVIDGEVDAWKMGLLASLLSEYSSKDIFEADEFRLFFGLLPDETLF